MIIASWNVNGLRAVLNKRALQQFIDAVTPDVLFLQEIKCKPEQVKYDFGNYAIFYNSAERSGYSGTAVLIKPKYGVDDTRIMRNLPDKIVNCYNGMQDRFGHLNQEGRVIGIDLGRFYAVGVYTPNAKSDLSRLQLREQCWDPAFLAYIEDLRQTKPVVFCGDLNVAAEEIDLAHPKQNRGKAGFTDEERVGWHNYQSNGFIDSFRYINGDIPDQYTWWSHWANARANNVGWRIDYFMVDQVLKNQLKNAKIYSSQLGSDHCPITIEVENG